jgi:hypothetical protein
MPIEVGKYPNGETVVRVRLSLSDSRTRIDATVEGVGDNADIATERLQSALQQLSDEAADAAAAME